MGPLSTHSRLMGLEKVGYDPKGGPPRNTGFCQDYGQVVPFSALLYEIIKALPCFETDSHCHHQGTSVYARGAKGLGPFVQRPVNDRRVGGQGARAVQREFKRQSRPQWVPMDMAPSPNRRTFKIRPLDHPLGSIGGH